MATTVKQFKDYLATLPEDADVLEIEVLRERSANWQTWTDWVPLELPTEGGYSNEMDIIGKTLCLGRKD